MLAAAASSAPKRFSRSSFLVASTAGASDSIPKRLARALRRSSSVSREEASRPAAKAGSAIFGAEVGALGSSVTVEGEEGD